MKNLIICALAIFFCSIGVLSVHPHDAESQWHDGETPLPWAEHIQTFQNLLKTDPASARAELQNIAKNVFVGHVLTEEWVPLYFRVNHEKSRQRTDITRQLSDIKRVFELELRMMTDIDAEKYAVQIQRHREAMEHYTEMSSVLPKRIDKIDELPKKTSPGEHGQMSQAPRELYDIGEQHLKSFRELLPTNPEGALAELDTYTTLLFHNHPLIEEWKKLYVPIVRNQGALLPEIIRYVEIEKQMLTDTDAEMHAEKIETLAGVEKYCKSIAKMLERQGILDTKFVPFTIK